MTPTTTPVPLLLTSLLLAALMPVVARAYMPSGSRTYAASAYALEGDELLYVERHVETWREGRLAERAVSYEDATGNLIAEKQVRYGADPEVPSFEMIDHRTGQRESALVESGRVELFSGDHTGRDRPRRLALPENAVIDAGFDAFMRENFAEIVRGQSLEFDFAVPAARRFFKFQLQPQGDLDHDGREAILVKMKPASAFLRLVVDPIDLIYGRDGRLLEFRGLSNVCDEQGERHKVRIVFDYRTAPAAPAVATIGRTIGR